MAKIRAVTGDISPAELGITLMHDHLLVDNNPWRTVMHPKDERKRLLAEAPVTLQMRGEISRDANLCADNNVLDSISDAASEMLEYRMAGGRSLVDVTPIGIGRDHMSIAKISKMSGLNVICGTGWYADFSLPPWVREANSEQLSEMMRKELTEGIEGTDIHAGLIGEIGCSYPWTDCERKVLEAAAIAQVRTGAPLTIHPGLHDLQNRRYVKQASEYLDFLQNKGVDFERVYVSHMDMTADDTAYHRSIIDKYGVVLGYDNFGNEMYYDTIYPGCGGIPDKMRVKGLVDLLGSGYEKHLVLSQDICLKIALRKYGGYGYSHVLRHIVPEILAGGVTQRQVDTMLVENPKRILAWA